MSSGVCRTAGFLSEACCAFTRHPGHRRGYVAKQVLLAKRRLSGNDVASPSGACSAPWPSKLRAHCKTHGRGCRSPETAPVLASEPGAFPDRADLQAERLAVPLAGSPGSVSPCRHRSSRRRKSTIWRGGWSEGLAPIGLKTTNRASFCLNQIKNLGLGGGSSPA